MHKQKTIATHSMGLGTNYPRLRYLTPPFAEPGPWVQTLACPDQNRFAERPALYP